MPVLGIVQVGSQSMADRYTYLPCLGVFLAVGLMVAKVYEKTTGFTRWKVILRGGGLLIAMTILVALSVATIKQIGVWRNSIVFWNYIIEKEPERVPVAHNNLGVAYAAKGELDLAIDQYQTALRLNPGDALAYFNLGNAYLMKGLADMAIEQYHTALSLKPDYARAHFNLGMLYVSNGSLELAQKEFEAVLQIKPDDYRAQQMLESIILK
jgi:tetratricopeptide (TPR) repeat protein